MAAFLIASLLVMSVSMQNMPVVYGHETLQPKIFQIAQTSQPGEAQPFSVPVRIIEQPETKTETGLREDEADARDAKDLAIQERLKDLAQDTLRLSYAQLVLAAVGTIGLLYSLFLARKSTAAAVSAVKVTRQTARDQLRPYVLVETSRVTFNQAGGASVIVTFRNGGQTPALSMVTGANMKVDDPNHPTPLPPFTFEDHPLMSRFSVLPGSMREKEVGPIPAGPAGALATGEVIMHIWGEVRYSDIFGRSHFTRFHLMGGGSYGFREGMALIVRGVGNVEGEYSS
ncbi:hypothetical protein HJB86_07955 [Rhizobium sp. NZLR3b]|uniref:hypothetical protein n=1 Tax=Rhizobium sp. NZLR3b TaxID=2731101 RepID=UPI001C83BB5E|nr:hypothetical protein [Rhizobium sp. NZLR3b]MBX5188838.1 hypothetical protein [Rhizobium sp. NZLR3b]